MLLRGYRTAGASPNAFIACSNHPSREPALRLREFEARSDSSEREESCCPKATEPDRNNLRQCFQRVSFSALFLCDQRKRVPSAGTEAGGFACQIQNPSKSKPRGRGPERRHTLLSCQKEYAEKDSSYCRQCSCVSYVASHQHLTTRPTMGLAHLTGRTEETPLVFR